MAKKVFIYLSILITCGLFVGGSILFDFANTPYPPDLALVDYAPQSMLVTSKHLIDKPKFPVIDFHSHPQESGLNIDQINDILDQSGIARVVDLDGQWGRSGKRLQRMVEAYNLKYPGKFIVFLHISFRGIGKEGFIEDRLRQLAEAKKMGVRGIKVWKDLGMSLRDNSGKLVTIDDRRLDPIWEKAGELNFPVLMHVGDPPAFWQRTDRFNERYEEAVSGEDYVLQGDFPALSALLEQRENLIKRHPGTIIVGAHMGSLGWNLKELSRLLDTYPNFYVDVSDRLYELGRQPYTARKFFIKYQDRLLFGIDLYPEVKVYQTYYRFFETFDEYFDYPRSNLKHGRWKIYGISLPDSVLKKVYYLNALKLINS